MKNYYLANKVSWGGIEFDSQFEFSIFKVLRDYFPLTGIKIHEPLIIRPATKWFDKQEWKIDYVCSCEDIEIGNRIYIECKGIIQDDFKERLKNLSYFCPTIFENLIIITPRIQTIVRGFHSYDERTLRGFLEDKNFQGLVETCKRNTLRSKQSRNV